MNKSGTTVTDRHESNRLSYNREKSIFDLCNLHSNQNNHLTLKGYAIFSFESLKKKAYASIEIQRLMYMSTVVSDR